MKVRFFAAVVLLGVLGVGLAGNVFAAAHFWPKKLDNTTFRVMADNVKDAYGLTLEITYDPKAFEKPVVTWGVFAQGELTDMNTDTPGRISLVLAGANVLPTTGEVATISFTPKGSVIGQNITVRPLLISQTGSPLGASPLPIDPGPSGGGDGGGPGGGGPGGGGPGGGGPGGGGPINPPGTTVTGGPTGSISTVNMKGFNESLSTSSGSRTPGRVERSGGAGSEPSSEVSGGRGESAWPSRGESRLEPKGPEKFVPNQSVLERFKNYTGARTVASMSALFAPRAPDGFAQTPAIAVADGTSTLTVTLAGDPAAKEDPTFGLIRARLVSLKRNQDGGWAIEVKPNKGAIAAVLAVNRSNVVTEYPLTVVPPADLKTDVSQSGVTEADFVLFLKERGTDREPRFDLNGDGKRDYMDDYIYTGNYLLVTGGAKPPDKGMKPQEPGAKPLEKGAQPAEAAKTKVEGAPQPPGPAPPKAGADARGKLPEQPRATPPKPETEKAPAPAPVAPLPGHP